MAEVQSVAYGKDGTEALRDAIRAAQDGDPLAPVTIVVPSNLAGLSARRTLAEQGGIANVAFDTPFGLAERLGRARAAAAGLTPITEPVLVAAIRVELRIRPGFFAPVAEHSATESALARRYAELSRARPATLDRIRRDGTPRAQALVELFDRVRARLASYVDEDTLVEHALHAVRESGSPVTGLGTVIVHLPQPLPPALHDLVGAVASVRPTTWIVALTGDASADAAVVDACRRWGVTVGGDAVSRRHRDRDDRRRPTSTTRSVPSLAACSSSPRRRTHGPHGHPDAGGRTVRAHGRCGAHRGRSRPQWSADPPTRRHHRRAHPRAAHRHGRLDVRPRRRHRVPGECSHPA